MKRDMISRSFHPPKSAHYLLVGPKDTGKSTWLKNHYADAHYVNLSDPNLEVEFLASPGRIWEIVPPGHKNVVIFDDVHLVPQVIPEILKKLSKQKMQVVLSCSSLRPLRTALKGDFAKVLKQLEVRNFYPLTAYELKKEFLLEKSIRAGHLAKSFFAADPTVPLSAFVLNLLKDEVQGEGFGRNIASFSRFLIAAAKNQDAELNLQHIADHAMIEKKQAEIFLEILEDLLVVRKLSAFHPRKTQKLTPKLYFFDLGVYRYLKNTSYQKKANEIQNEESEDMNLSEMSTLCFQELLAYNDMMGRPFEVKYWKNGDKEVAFVLEGKSKVIAIDIKNTRRLVKEDYEGLYQFLERYPQAKAFMLANVPRNFDFHGIQVMAYGGFMKYFYEILKKQCEQAEPAKAKRSKTLSA